MVHMNSEIVKNFIYSLNPTDIGDEYIHSARITNKEGNHVTLRGDALKKMLNGDPQYSHVTSDVFLNVQKVVETIDMEMAYLYMQVQKKFDRDTKK